jgi:hypothetical protein
MTVIIFLLILALAENTLARPSVRQHLPPPSISNGYQPTDIQFDELALEFLLDTFNRMRYGADLHFSPDQGAALARWWATKQAEFLQAAGVDYLIFSDQWATWLTREERAALDSDAYEKIQEWVHPPLGETFYLFKVHG